MKLNLPRLSYLNIGQRAETFLNKYHPSFSLPIPVEEIAELKLDLRIILIKRLKSDFDIDGFLDSTLTQIFIDFDLYTQQENRTRFTVAHEIGHWSFIGKFFKNLILETKKIFINLLKK